MQDERVTVLPLSVDGALHAQPAAAFDVTTGQVVALSSVSSALGARIKSLARDMSAKLRASTSEVGAGIQLAEMTRLPDLAVESISGTAPRLLAGQDVNVRVRVGNRGSQWTPDAERAATLRLTWDTSQARTATSASADIPALAPGESVLIDLAIEVPASIGADEQQALRAQLEVIAPDGDLDGGNDTAVLVLGGMPVPTAPQAKTLPGVRMAQISWEAPVDDRIAGFRIYLDDADGTPLPFGSSFDRGFVDLTARFGEARTYRISSYSARGIESALSAPITVEPADAPEAPEMFADGFE
jgi:hypothetical protein